ncbi:MAG: cupin domain-containing protein [Sphingomonadales bacterium]|nr:cupin domain-containing protein [Sphingomonadales bacterium]
MQLNDFDTGTFLRDYWQQKPLLIRNPWTSWRNPLAPDELAGLACESEVESRLVMRRRGGWAVEHGPIAEQRFSQLGRKGWTLLVQAVDHHVPEVAALIEPFRFIPNWRIDDVMVSYAADEGGVGPHFDQYDVFLVQGLGQRRWQIGGRCDQTAKLLPHDELRLLEQFEAIDEWVLEPGDMLYLPPRVAHNGIAVGGDCMTYSIGFRAPSRRELIALWSDHALGELGDDDRYADPGLPIQDNPGEISAQAIARLHDMAMERLRDRDAFARWFGRHSSARRYPDVDWQAEQPIGIDELRVVIAGGATLCRNPASRFAFVRQSPGLVLLFVDGACFECAGQAMTFAERICAQERVRIEALPDAAEPLLAMIAALHDQGSLAFEPED